MQYHLAQVQLESLVLNKKMPLDGSLHTLYPKDTSGQGHTSKDLVAHNYFRTFQAGDSQHLLEVDKY